MDEEKKIEDHMQSAAAFVEGGIQEACDDACSICLEAFCDSDPSTLTGCKHEFHLQCILEWCQRSSNCPMCWQAISLKDPSSQELLEAVERERSIRSAPTRSSAMFHHPILGDFELQHLPVGVSGAELEERIIQHLATAAAMGRARRTARREGPRIRPSAHSRPQLTLFSNHHDDGSISSSLSTFRGESEPPSNYDVAHTNQTFASASGSPIVTDNRQGSYVNNRHPGLVPNEDRAGPSDLQSSLESLKTRFNTMSMRYKETISKSTRGWKERLFSRNASTDDLPPENSGDSNSGNAEVASPAVAADALDTEQLHYSNEEIHHHENLSNR